MQPLVGMGGLSPHPLILTVLAPSSEAAGGRWGYPARGTVGLTRLAIPMAEEAEKQPIAKDFKVEMLGEGWDEEVQCRARGPCATISA